MIPEIGQVALIIALILSVCQGAFGLAGASANRAPWMAAARSTAIGACVFCAVAFGVLTSAFLANDFSVQYVANNSNSELPTFYRVAAVWGGHEGSLLLWILVQSIWTAAVAVFSGRLPPRFASRVLGILGLIGIGFLLFTLLTSNPFLRFEVAPPDGRDLNPLLQDFGLAVHPPILYMGYVGLSVAFAFSVACMLEGRLDAAWARWTRPWTVVAWMFLTIGIALGSWWAYYELGWGGWWFWDPVENASFMPWLIATALIHSLAVTAKRGLFMGWTLLLGVAGFSLSLLGTFLVRSGVLISVHSFASDPARGAFILAFFGVVVFGSTLLYAMRARAFQTNARFSLWSRETALLMNNVLLVVAAGAILSNTLAPLLAEWFNEKISVGPQVFNAFFVPMTLILALALGVGMHLPWRQSGSTLLRRRLLAVAALALVVSVAVPLLVFGSGGMLLTVAGVAAAAWVILSSLSEPWQRFRSGRSLRRMPAPVVGMLIAHIGVGLTILGVTVTSMHSIELDGSMRIGETHELGEYTLRFDALDSVPGPNYEATRATVSVTRDGEPIAVLFPEKRLYRVQRNPMTEAGIQGRLSRDLFVALGEPLGDGAWSFRMQYKPLVRFIWLGAIVMALGGGIALSGRRQGVERRAEAGQGGEVAAS